MVPNRIYDVSLYGKTEVHGACCPSCRSHDPDPLRNMFRTPSRTCSIPPPTEHVPYPPSGSCSGKSKIFDVSKSAPKWFQMAKSDKKRYFWGTPTLKEPRIHNLGNFQGSAVQIQGQREASAPWASLGEALGERVASGAVQGTHIHLPGGATML